MVRIQTLASHLLKTHIANPVAKLNVRPERLQVRPLRNRRVRIS